MNPTRTPLWHGYSYDHIDHLTRAVTRNGRWRTDVDVVERMAVVRHAITEHLATAAERPTRRELFNLGLQAANRYVRIEMHHRGYDMRRIAAGPGALPGFQRYWQGNGRLPLDERVVERLALTQVWPALTDLQQQAVMALAITEDHQAAADKLGVPLVTYSSRLRKARRAVIALWHEHETPRRQGRDKRVLARSGTYRGRQLLTERDLERLRQLRAGGTTYKQLAVETGYSAGALCNLLRGKRRAARDGDGRTAETAVASGVGT